MGQIALQIPQSGQPNSTEDAKVANNFTTLQTWANGNVDATNLSPTSGIVRLAYHAAAANYSASAGDWVVANAGITVTLPSPVTANQVVAIRASGVGVSGASPVTVSGTSIYGVGLSGASSFLLGTPASGVILQSDGARWYTIAGERDTGWVALTLGAGISAQPGALAPSARLQGDTVTLKGAMLQGNGSGVAFATLPSASMYPSATVSPPNAQNIGTGILISSGGALTTVANVIHNGVLYVDGVSYQLS